MTVHAEVLAAAFCMSCGGLLTRNVRFRWGALPEQYQAGDDIRWWRGSEGSVDHSLCAREDWYWAAQRMRDGHQVVNWSASRRRTSGCSGARAAKVGWSSSAAALAAEPECSIASDRCRWCSDR